MPFFQQSMMRTECDRCGSRFDLMHGGVCEQCKRILCFRHLHGSWLRRLRTDWGTPAVCIDCRSGASSAAR